VDNCAPEKPERSCFTHRNLTANVAIADEIASTVIQTHALPVAGTRGWRRVTTLTVGLLVADDAAFGCAECASDDSPAGTAKYSTDDCSSDSTDCAVLLPQRCGTGAKQCCHRHKHENDFGTHLLLQKRILPGSEMLTSFHSEPTDEHLISA
jgi:hypothetical protein